MVRKINGLLCLSFYQYYQYPSHYIRCSHISTHTIFPCHAFSLLGERFVSMVLWWCRWDLWNPWAITPYCFSSLIPGQPWFWLGGPETGYTTLGLRNKGTGAKCSQWGVGLGKKGVDPGGWQLTAQLMLLEPWSPSREGQGLLRWNPPGQVKQKFLCQQTGPAGEESFKLGKIRERDMTTHRQVRKWWNGLANKGYRVMQTRRALEKNVSGLKAEVGSMNYQSNTQFCLMF